MATGKVSIDGRVVDSGEARVSVFDRGFLYGDSVFEVFRTYSGVPFAQREHLERLQRSADRLMIPMPVSMETLSSEVAATLAAAGEGEWYVRIVVTRGTGPLTYDLSTATAPLRVIIAAPVSVPPAEHYERGIAVSLLHASRPTDDERASGAKASNYLANLLAVHEAKQKGAQEALVLGRRGQILEGASSNVFIVKDGKVRTPEPQPGILVGITRATVIAAAAAAGIEVEEGEVRPEDLYGADEAFLTSSIREVMPVVAADGRTIGSGAPGSLTKRLHEGYLRAVAQATGSGV
ncbi:MAG: aminotransferase class IV [Deltaproteobacteria bacterium]|nr:aminotransferase class IV [Deltaproteobacteria bacterium]MBW1875503.1 aminotransferase class IV [Deltaproteobacteria bacterium]MBW2210422.1 aminotransferase class IV [Deltaproteobacteria bacterium]MBW2215178.1 aminotransferase class IV [Deltaproteobacteria bacterium]MBW2380769.1 aminotransferase class IV [Deltaproteobacteria bacterium]